MSYKTIAVYLAQPDSVSSIMKVALPLAESFDAHSVELTLLGPTYTIPALLAPPTKRTIKISHTLGSVSAVLLATIVYVPAAQFLGMFVCLFTVVRLAALA